jgi:ubiquinone biosynthesis protein
MPTAMQDIKRARDIVSVGAKYGFMIDPAFTAKVPGLGMLRPEKDIADLSRGERAKRVLEELGPTFVKLGQVLSIRADLIPADIVDSLKALQKNVAPMPADELRATIEGYLGAPIEEHFATFDMEPMAAASIAQVHRAKLKNGDDVVVKVQRPGIREKMESDLSILYWLARLAEGSIVEAGLYQPVGIVREFEAALLQELDFLHEARNIEECTRNFASRPGLLVVPRVYNELTSTKLLVMSFVDGIRITDIVGKPEYNPEDLLQRALEVIFEMVFTDGFFHGDPHPGNVLVALQNAQSRIAMLDFGLMGRLTKEQQDTLIQLALAVFAKNPTQLTRIVMKMGQVPPDFNRLEFEAEVRRLMDKYLGVELAQINSQNLIRECMEMIVRHHVRLPSDYAVLGRAAGTIEGIGRIIYPEFNIIKIAAPFVTRLVQRRLDPSKLGTEAMGLALSLQQLLADAPLQASRLLDDLEGGRIQLGVRGQVFEELLAAQRTGSVRFVLVTCAATLFLCAAITMAPFQYTFTWGAHQWPLIATIALFLSGFFLSTLFLTFLFPQGPRKLSLKWLLFWKRR